MTRRPKNMLCFTAESAALPMNYPGFVFRTLCEEGFDAESLLTGTGLKPELFVDPYFRTDFSTLRRFIRNALEQTGDPHLGARLALRFEVGYIGPPAYAAINAPRLSDGLEVLGRFSFLTFPAIEFIVPKTWTGSSTGEAEIRLRTKLPCGDVEYFVTSSALLVANALLKEMLRAPLVASYAETSIAEPDGWSEIAPDISRVPVRFEAPENRIVFPAELLDEALPGADPINHRRLLEVCEKFAAEAGYDHTPACEVLAFLEKDGNIGASLTQAAAALGYSERSLRRQLEKMDTSYRRLCDQVREHRARDLLANTAQPIQTIAHDLGYDTPSNFARSFKRWTGASPRAFREARRAGGHGGQY